MPVALRINNCTHELTLAEAANLVAQLKIQISQTTEFTPVTVASPRINDSTGYMGRNDVFKFFDQFYSSKQRDRRAGRVFAHLVRAHRQTRVICPACKGVYDAACVSARGGSHAKKRITMLINAQALLDERQQILASIKPSELELRFDMELLYTHLVL